MDHPRDSVWITPLETTPLSTDEEAEAQTPVSLEGSMNWFMPGIDGPCDIRRRGRPSDPYRTARVRIGSSGLHAQVSRRSSVISPRSVMNNSG